MTEPKCRCTYNYTCGYCLDNRKPWFYTLSGKGGAIAVTDEQVNQFIKEKTNGEEE